MPENFMRIFLLLLSLFTAPVFAAIQIVAAENIYGNIAQTLGGQEVQVTSILNSPNQDPHLFSADPKTVKTLNNAKIIIINGADYDPWAEKLAKNTGAEILNVALINHVSPGANPHLWYNIAYVEAFATKFTSVLSTVDPQHQKYFQKNLQAFLRSTKNLQQQMQQLKPAYPRLFVTATEPVPGYLIEALGWNMLNQHFQLSVMNDTEPSAKDRAAMIKSIETHQAALLFYNQQVTDPTTDTIRQLAEDNHLPTLAVTELLPAQMSFIDWFQMILNNIKAVLR
jgi:zinc/manganese transport system substrate-binding protein